MLSQMPTRVIDIQRGFREIGALRMGTSEAKGQGKIPKKSQFWILTSNDPRALAVAAAQFGGTVEEWPDPSSRHSHRLTTKMIEIPVMISPVPASQSYEQWSGGECQRRCNGQWDRLNECPCQCPSDVKQRAAMAATGKACKLTTRVGFILPSVPDLGVWRLETHGFYAAIELPQTTDFLQAMAVQGAKIPAFLAIEIRKSRTKGQTKTYPVPVVRLANSMNELQALPTNQQQAIGVSASPQLAASNPENYTGPVVHEEEGLGI